MYPACVAIHEVVPSGHHLPYVRLLIDYCHQIGIETVLLTSEDVLGSDEFVLHLPEETMQRTRVHRVRRDEWPGSSLPPRCSHLILLDGDPWLKCPSVYRRHKGYSVSVLVTRDPWLRRSGLRARIADAAKRQMVRALKIHPSVQPVRLAAFGREPSPSFSIDPFLGSTGIHDADVVPDIRNKWHLDTDDVDLWVGMLGVVAARKGLELAVDTLAELKRLGHHPGLLLAGPIDVRYTRFQAEAERLQSHGIPFRVSDRVLNNDEINRLAQEVDVLLAIRDLPYPNSSLNKAVALGQTLVLSSPKSSARAKHEPSYIKRTSSRDHIELASLLLDAASIDQREKTEVEWSRLFAEPLLSSGMRSFRP